MLDRELIKKLNNLKAIKPDNQWKNHYREVLYSQISASYDNNLIKENKYAWAEFYKKLIPYPMMVELSKPVWITIIMIVVFSSGSLASVYASRDAKPGDSLYLAKIISEKAKFAITFDEKSKAKLNLEFASNRAQEITQVISEANKDKSQDNNKVEQLSKSFKKEITAAKNRLSKMNINNLNDKILGNKIATLKSDGQDQEVFGANLEKDNQRMEISEPKKEVTELTSKATTAPATVNNSVMASSTIDNSMIVSTSPDKILDEAEKLFDEKNYNGTIDKLQEVNQIIDQTNSDNKGEVKGAADSNTISANATASSTQ